VYQLIDGEREYQNRLPPNRTDNEPRTVGDYLTMLQHYLNDAQREWVMNAGSQQALDVVRKIAGIAVHCMEDHGAPARFQDSRYDIPAGVPSSFLTRATPRQPSKKLPVDPVFRKRAKAKKKR
jgi:hypothetical protein